MRLCNIVLTIVLALGGDPPTDGDGSADDKLRVQESTRRVLELACKYEFYSDGQQRTKLELQSQPVLTYSNPVQGEVYGNVYVWTDHGRPEVVGAIFDFRSEDRMDSEFHFLASAGTAGHRDGRQFLNPGRAGVEFRPVPEVPLPAATAAGRLRQMRELAREFTVERDHPQQKREFMRMLTQPIYRYSAAAPEVVDGAMFVFVEGTDPEAFLLFEAAGAEKPVWRYAFARMNLVEFWGRHKNEVIWHVDAVDWNAVFEQHTPYAIVRERPRRGFDRSR
jgi:hypothetical protein